MNDKYVDIVFGEETSEAFYIMALTTSSKASLFHATIKGIDSTDKNVSFLLGEDAYFGEQEILQESPVEKRFLELSKNWRKETRGMSTMLHMAMNDNYLDIIAMGPIVIPYILKDLARKPDHWFVALEHLTRTNPIPLKDRGNIEKMTKAWLEWGKSEGRF